MTMFIFSNLAMTLDGKIATKERSFFPLGTPEDRRQMLVLRQQCDAVLIGASTFRCFKKPSRTFKDSRQPINIIVSSTLEGISPQWEFFRTKNLTRILFVSEKISKKKIDLFKKTCEIYVLKKGTVRNPIALQIIRILENKGIRRLLVEGGGGIMWDFVSQDLIDEFHVTLTPKIVGGDTAPTLVDGKGFRTQEILSLKLRQCRVVGDEIYLIYSRPPRKLVI